MIRHPSMLSTPVKKVIIPKWNKTYGDKLLEKVSQKLRADRIVSKKGRKQVSKAKAAALTLRF